MKYEEIIKNRYSVRKFSERDVDDSILQKILEAGNIAPTAKNIQPQRILLLKSEEARAKLANGCTLCLFNAPICLLVCHDSDISFKRPADGLDAGETDAAIVTTHMMLAAISLGLGSCWIGLIDPEKIKAEYSLPNNLVPHCLIYIGYPSEDCPISPKHFIRKRLDETVKVI